MSDIKELEAQLKEKDEQINELKKQMESMFDSNYVKELRAEAAKHRAAKQEAISRTPDEDEYKKFLEFQKNKEEFEKQKMNKEQIEEFWKSKVKAVEEDKNILNNTLENYKKEAMERENNLHLNHKLLDLMSKAGAINPKITSKVIRDNVSVIRDDDGRVSFNVMDSKGNVMKDEKMNPITLETYVDKLKTDNDYAHLFNGGKGGTGSRSSNQMTSGMKNPWSKDTYNLTEQFKIQTENPQLAELLAGEASQT